MAEPDRGQPGTFDQTPQLRLVAAKLSASPHWNTLSDASKVVAFCSAWLSLQCARIAGVNAGLLVIRLPHQSSPVVSVGWPERGGADRGDLKRVAERAFAERRCVVAPMEVGADGGAAQTVEHLVAVPLGAGGRFIAVAAVSVATSRGAAGQEPEAVAEQLQWGAGWLEALPWARRLADIASDKARAVSCLHFLATIGGQHRLMGMAIAVANDLVVRFACDRVHVGLVRRDGRIRLRAMSHSATFKHQGQLVDAIENAMEEAIDQRSSVAYPPLHSTERAFTAAHQVLAEAVRNSGASLLTIVLADGKGRLIGAITFERHHRVPFEAQTLRLAEAMGALFGPIVGLQLSANRLIAGRLVDAMGDGIAALLGPRRPGLKLAAIAATVVGLALVLAKGEHRVTAKSVLEAEVQRAAVAPFEGFIRIAPARAGDTVRNGDLLAALDDRDLTLDRLKWRAERDKLLQKQRDALAKHDRTNIAVLDAQIRQAEAQLALAEQKLERARIVAPFDGIVVSGDLSQMLGSPVEKGKTLFEIAPLDAYRLIVQVDERDVRYIAPGQSGTLALTGMPWSPFPLILDKITPVTMAEEGRNAFRVEARLTELDPRVRPGMEGVAKINTGQRSLLSIWTRAIMEWLRLAAWKYLP